MWHDSIAVRDVGLRLRRIANDPPEECIIGGFAGVDIYGARFAAKHLIALAAVSAFFGLRGFIVGSVAWAIYKYNQTTAAQPPASGQSARSSASATNSWSARGRGQKLGS